ncbi:MAG: 16S rRNA (guanine(527)-N(7))-methyltransferase RsmG [Clostridia bacterium]|jgi:16S rRNA (guanine527-N7)-methyltransferase|nr:16S rRNA (guanine(527)-N(7))-methyltransferase RsmG [Clostridia bacterium]MCI2015067.1 16S rRNA (guanine(527)-N(7))-methyltransferase RsmG [Clostridia bacterium]
MGSKELLSKACLDMGISLTEGQLSQFKSYKDTLLDWNKKINLTAITDEREIMIKHFADSVSPLPFMDKKDGTLIDVGTGAGFPGVPLKIANPDFKVTLLDSLNKRINFLEELKNKIDIDIICIHSRAEDGGKDSGLRESFDYCVSRAVAKISVLSEYCLPFVKLGGYFISLKGPDVEEELKDGINAVKKLGGEVSDIKKIKVPESDIVHSIVFIKKVAQTPKTYPRKAGMAVKKPL